MQRSFRPSRIQAFVVCTQHTGCEDLLRETAGQAAAHAFVVCTQRMGCEDLPMETAGQAAADIAQDGQIGAQPSLLPAMQLCIADLVLAQVMAG